MDGYRELPTGRDLESLAAKVGVNRGTAYRLAPMARKQTAAAA